MRILALVLLLPASFLLQAKAPQNSEIFTPESLSSGMSLEANGYRFEIVESGGVTALLAKSPSGMKKTVELHDAGFSRPERLFYVKSHGCNIESIDVVIQFAPEPNEDIKYRNYYRIVFAKDMSSVVSEFFDPSVAAANAVLPIQSVRNLEDKYTKEKITCKGSKPIVEEKK
ncbi:hypothetical protein JR065_05870 [Xanthomonas sp. AmX2]|uniref:hypothetical protein n=1 Tax=Xanthomonas sp. TaxID=29446 RepID=UPI00198180FC|nr:hypothetical protein [Xanthomonas sp.]MBN6149859.1 hypothetical protein [Xanthomonas sp.]